MANSIVKLTVEDSSFNAKIKQAAKTFADFGKNVASAGADAFSQFARGAKTAKVAFEGFNAALKANALVLVASLAVQVGSAIGEMIGNWITGADDAADAQEKLNEKLEETARLIENINNEGDFNARIAKAAGASTSEILQMRLETAQAAYNAAMSTLFDPNIKVGSDEYKKAKQLFEQAEKRVQKARQDIKVDEVARAHKTGEYTPKGGGGGRRSTKTPKDEEQLINEEIKKLTKEYRTASEERQAAIRDEIKLLQDQLALYKQLDNEAQGKAKPIQKIEMETVQGVIPSFYNLEKPKLSFEVDTTGMNALQKLEAQLKSLIEQQKIFGGASSELWQMFQQEVDRAQEKIDIFKGKSPMKQVDEDAKRASTSFSDAASSIAAVGSALQSIEDPSAKIAGIIGQAIANIALGFAQATAAASGGGPFAWIAAIAGGLGTMVSTIEAIHSATGYAQGGVVTGNSYSGDNIPIMANAGEVVLTKAMANNLASSLQSTGLQNLRLSATVSGTQLRFVLNNESQMRGRGQYVTTNFNG